MVALVKLRRVMSSIMRRRKGVMCGSFAGERGVEVTNPFMMPQRSRGEAQSADPGGQTPPGQRGTRGEASRREGGAGTVSDRAGARSCPPRSGLVQHGGNRAAVCG